MMIILVESPGLIIQKYVCDFFTFFRAKFQDLLFLKDHSIWNAQKNM